MSNRSVDYDVLSEVVNIDITDPQLYADEQPERIWQTLRTAETPVRFNGLRDHWVMTRYQHVEAVFKSARSFSTQKGMHLGSSEKEIYRDTGKCRAELAAEAAAGKSLAVTDNPIHAEMRKAIGAAFTHRMVRRLTDRTLAIAQDLVSCAATGDPVDFVQAVAAPLPAIVICELLGVPESDRKRLMELTRGAITDSGDNASSLQLTANTQLLGYCDELIASKRRAPGEDVATVLARASLQGKPMTHESAVLNCLDLITAGNETVLNASAAVALTMVAHPASWAELRDGRVGVDDATEELLRLEAPISHVMRLALEDTEIGGVNVRRGEYVTMWLRSANRDDEIFENPEDLDFSRRPNNHLTFGLDNHFCLGSFLARIEIRSIVRALLESVDYVELCGQPERLASNFLRGYRSLPLSLKRR